MSIVVSGRLYGVLNCFRWAAFQEQCRWIIVGPWGSARVVCHEPLSCRLALCVFVFMQPAGTHWHTFHRDRLCSSIRVQICMLDPFVHGLQQKGSVCA